jgi:N,N'-diacetyllegionaminate synthase
MKIKDLNTRDKVVIIAEIGNNHEGSYSLAEDMIGLAVESGADAVKFQTFQTEHYVSVNDKERYKRLKSFELTFNEFEKLSNIAKELGILFISTPFDLESALFLNSIVDAIKISSGDNTFYPLIESVAETGKPIIMSTGLADIQQIMKSKTFIENLWAEKDIVQDLAILHCVSAYPVEAQYANLRAIQSLHKSLDCTVGLSDHTIGTTSAIASVALGARIIEKHFTIDKHFSDFRDHQISCDPQDMKLLVGSVREAEKMMGSGAKVAQLPEKDSAPLMRRSIVAKHSLSEGHVLKLDDITWVRPSGGLKPGEEQRIIGKRLSQAIKKGEKILIKHIVDNK